MYSLTNDNFVIPFYNKRTPSPAVSSESKIKNQTHIHVKNNIISTPPIIFEEENQENVKIKLFLL